MKQKHKTKYSILVSKYDKKETTTKVKRSNTKRECGIYSKIVTELRSQLHMPHVRYT
jgi:hypothetical protein